MGDFFGSLVGAAGSLLGGILGQNTQSDIAQQNLQFQEFEAAHGISQKVADAKAAGINPLVALGASTFNPSAVTVGNALGEGVSSAGQDVGRAVSALMPNEKSRADQLNEELLQAKIDNVNADTTHQMFVNSQVAKNLGQPGTPHTRGYTDVVLPARTRFQMPDGTIVEEPSKEFTQSSFSSWPGIGGVVKSVAHDIGNIGWGSPGDALRAYLVRPDVVRSVSGSQNIP